MDVREVKCAEQIAQMRMRGGEMLAIVTRTAPAGCTTCKWKLSRPALLPVVFKLAVQMAAAESQNRVSSSNGPEHS